MGILITATIINKLTSIILNFRTVGLIKLLILSFIEYKDKTKYVWATTSKIINDSITTLLKSLYIAISKLIPKKIEWRTRLIAEAIPKNTNFLQFQTK